MKNFIISILQKVFGMNNYLFLTSVLKISRKKIEPLNKDFFYFLNMLNEGYNVLDIGANVGIMTYYLSKRVINGNVYAFEPILDSCMNIKKLLRFYNLNNVQVYNCALGDSEKIISMNMPIIHTYKAHTYSYVMQNQYYHETSNVVTYDVLQKKLDEINEFQTLKIDAIKIDVENYEYFVFSGGGELIKKNRPLIYTELWQGTDNQIKSFDLLSNFGYQKPKILVDDKLIEFNSKVHHSSNFFFLPIKIIF